MKFSDAELALISEALDQYSWEKHKPTKVDDITALSTRVEKQLTAHNWKMVGTPGMFDDNYQCTKCGQCESESSDTMYQKPKYGCTGKKE